MAIPFTNGQELEDAINQLRREKIELKKALLEMRDAAEMWKALAEALVRCSKQKYTLEDLARVKAYHESIRDQESKPS